METVRVDSIIDFFLIFFFTLLTSVSHLFAAKVKLEVLEIFEAFVGEAWAAQHTGDVGHGGEVIAQRAQARRVHVQLAVAVTSSEVLVGKVLTVRAIVTQQLRGACRSAEMMLCYFIISISDELSQKLHTRNL